MTKLDRRTALAAVGIGLGTALAGCIDSGANPGDDEDTETDDGDGEETTTADPGEPTAVEYDVIQYETGTSAPDWYDRDEEPTGAVTLIDSESRLESTLSVHDLPEDRRDAVESFLADVDFEKSVVLLVSSVGPDTCHDEIEIESLALEDGTLTGRAAAVDTSEEGAACGEALTFPSALVKAEGDGSPPSGAEITVVDGWGTEETIVATADESSSPDPDGLEGYVRPDGDPSVVPDALECDDPDFERHPPGYDEDDLEWGEAGNHDDGPGFALRVNDLAFDRGEAVRVTLTNVADERLSTGNESKYNLEVRTDEGWQDVRGRADGGYFEYTDEAISHDPGEGITWTVEMTDDGVVEDDHFHADAMSVCPGLPAGRYRFVFWEPTVAVAFDVRE